MTTSRAALCRLVSAGLLATHAPLVIAQTPNACALLKVAEIQPVAPAVRIGDGAPSAHPFGPACQYQWSTGTGRDRRSGNLTVNVADGAKMWPGTPAALVKQALLQSANPTKPGRIGAVIPGVGEAAVFTSDVPEHAKAEAYLKGHILIITLEEPHAREMKEHVIALMKAAASRY